MLGPKRLGKPDRRVEVLRDPDAADHATRTDDADGLFVRRHVADGLQDDMGAVAAGELADLGDALLAALGDHVGRAELEAEIRADLVPAHQNDALGPELPRRQDSHQTDRAVTDHGDGGAVRTRHP